MSLTIASPGGIQHLGFRVGNFGFKIDGLVCRV
jgi:hypothetical protein